jgi:transposase
MVILHHSGMTIPEVAEALGCDERTVERWITRFNDTLSVTALPRPGEVHGKQVGIKT